MGAAAKTSRGCLYNCYRNKIPKQHIEDWNLRPLTPQTAVLANTATHHACTCAITVSYSCAPFTTRRTQISKKLQRIFYHHSFYIFFQREKCPWDTHDKMVPLCTTHDLKEKKTKRTLGIKFHHVAGNAEGSFQVPQFKRKSKWSQLLHCRRLQCVPQIQICNNYDSS